MFRRLASDDWVLGIAAAIAIGYALVEVVHAFAGRVLPFLADENDFGHIIVELRGRKVALDELILDATTLAVVVVLAAFVLRRAAPRRLGE